MRRSSTIGPGLQRTASTGSAESASQKNRRTTLDALQGLRSDDPVVRLADQERESERLQDELEALKAQLSLRPPRSELEKLKQENKELESLIAAYQRENEKATRASEVSKSRERLLEQALEKQLGPAWSEILEIPASPAPDRHLPSFPSSASRANLSSGPSSFQPNPNPSTPVRPLHPLRNNSSSSNTSTPTPLQHSFVPSPGTPRRKDEEEGADQQEAGVQGTSREELDEVRGQVDSLKALIQGMERRVMRREGESAERMRRAEEEARRWREGSKEGVTA